MLEEKCYTSTTTDRKVFNFSFRTLLHPSSLSWTRGMSKQEAVSGGPSMNNTLQSSTTASTTITPASTSTVPPSDHLQGTSSATIGLMDKSQSTSNLSSGTISSRQPRIPKLSAATTELLARVNGYFRGGNNRPGNSNYGSKNDVAGLNTTMYDPSDSASAGLNKMKASSAIIELPTAPFECSSTTAAPAASSANLTNKDPDPANSLQPQQQGSTGLVPVSLAPKPIGTQTSFPPADGTMQSQFTASADTTTAATATVSSTGFSKPQKAPSSTRKRRSAANGAKRSSKRRRGNDSDGEGVIKAGDSSSDETDVTPTATQTKSGRQVNRPSLYMPPPASNPVSSKGNADSVSTPDSEAFKTTTAASSSRRRKRVYRKGKDVYINCCHCQRSHSPPTNTIVFCDECNDAWHQSCHDPPICDEVISVKEKKWFCRECKPVPHRITQPTVVRSSPDRRPSNAPVQPPPVTPQREVGGENFSIEERRGYLSSLSHSALVELLVTLSDCQPSLEMFPANLKELQLSKFSFQPGMSTVQPASLSNGEILDAEKSGTGKPSAASSTRKRHDFELSDESDYEQYVEHRLYPRAGNGFCLPLNVDDLDILREEPDCPTFSYALHGPAKARAEVNDAVPVWGAA